MVAIPPSHQRKQATPPGQLDKDVEHDQHCHIKDPPAHRRATTPPSTQPPRPNRSPLHPKHPMSPRFHRGGLHFEQPHGRFRTIDPSTGTRRWPIQATTGGFATIDPRHAGDTPQGSAYGSNSPQATTRGCNRATTQPRAGGTPRGYSKRGRREPTPCASALTHP